MYFFSSRITQDIPNSGSLLSYFESSCEVYAVMSKSRFEISRSRYALHVTIFLLRLFRLGTKSTVLFCLAIYARRYFFFLFFLLSKFNPPRVMPLSLLRAKLISLSKYARKSCLYVRKHGKIDDNEH